LNTEPIGLVEISLGREGLEPQELADAIWGELRPVIAQRMRAAGLTPPELLPVTGLRFGTTSPYLREREAVRATAPPISVVVCTRDPDEQIVACLDSLSQQEYPDYEVVVVDNAPTSDFLARLLSSRTSKARLRRIVEPRPGAASARNAGWRTATGEIVAFIDDDEIADPYWLAELARGFRARRDVKGVTGMILPVALDTQEQDWFEQAGGHVKGRGFTPAEFDVSSHAAQHPLYPLPPFGATGNMAIDREILSELGGFDVALGPGTLTRGGEDIAWLCDFMLAGNTLVYQPSALVRHHHHESWSGIANQFYGYGMGLTAFYTRAVLRHPRHIVTLARLAPRAFRDLFGNDSPRTARMRADYPAELVRLQRRGMLAGPVGYLRSLWRSRHTTQSTAGGLS
jgi:glycosyltransferase involved in cell wall biosynthesis